MWTNGLGNGYTLSLYVIVLHVQMGKIALLEHNLISVYCNSLHLFFHFCENPVALRSPLTEQNEIYLVIEQTIRCLAMFSSIYTK